jgi:hypothetical protein
MASMHPAHLVLQEELDMVEAMYPEAVVDRSTSSPCTGVIAINLDDIPVNLHFTLSLRYPEDFGEIVLASDSTHDCSAIEAWARSVQDDVRHAEMPLLQLIIALPERFERHHFVHTAKSLVKQDLSPVEQDLPVKQDIQREWIAFTSFTNIKTAKHFCIAAQSAQVNGFLLTGKPSYCCAEGSAADILSLWRTVRIEVFAKLDNHTCKWDELKTEQQCSERIFGDFELRTDCQKLGAPGISKGSTRVPSKISKALGCATMRTIDTAAFQLVHSRRGLSRLAAMLALFEKYLYRLPMLDNTKQRRKKLQHWPKRRREGNKTGQGWKSRESQLEKKKRRGSNV